MKTNFDEYSNWWFVQRMPIDIDYNFYTYVIKFDRFYKIGITNSLLNRFSTFRNHLPLEPELIGFFRFKDSGHYRMESSILNDLIGYKSKGEWVECNELQLMEVINHWELESKIKFIRNGK